MTGSVDDVLVTARLPEPGIAPLLDAGVTVTYRDEPEPMPADELRAAVAGRRAILSLLLDRIDAAVLDAAGPQLAVVANYAVGYDNVDLAAAAERGVTVTNTPDVLTEATADLAFGLLLAAARRLVEGDRLVRTGTWAGWRPTQLLGQPVHGQVLGLVGMGRIGLAVARRARGFGMTIRYFNRSPNEVGERELGAERVPLDELLATSDALSIHCPLTDETRHLIGAAALARMKPTAVLVNTARGPVVDEGALVAALRDGAIAAAGLDVYEAEPALHPGLAELDNVVLAPHLGSATTGTRAAMVRLACANITAVLAGEPPPTPVTP